MFYDKELSVHKNLEKNGLIAVPTKSKHSKMGTKDILKNGKIVFSGAVVEVIQFLNKNLDSLNGNETFFHNSILELLPNSWFTPIDIITPSWADNPDKFQICFHLEELSRLKKSVITCVRNREGELIPLGNKIFFKKG